MGRKKIAQVSIVFTILMIAATAPALAFNLKPEATDLDGKLRSLATSWWIKVTDEATAYVIDHFTNPVHEEITHRIFGCEGNRDACSSPKKPHNFASDAVIAGVRWNDNPPFELEAGGKGLAECRGKTIRLPNFSECWVKLFKDAKKRAKQGEVFDANSGAVLLYRVHFGDMQFLHAMATRDGEEGGETKRKILMWAELAYKLAIGEIDRSTELRKCGIPGMESIFGKRGWTAQQLFTRGDPTFRGKQDFRDFAFGTLLHLIEDSFAAGHVDRDESSGAGCEKATDTLRPGKIRSFHAFNRQDSKKHGKEDSHEALARHLLTTNPNVVDVGKVIKSYYEAKRPWTELKDYLECIFDIDDPTIKAGPGEKFLPE